MSRGGNFPGLVGAQFVVQGYWDWQRLYDVLPMSWVHRVLEAAPPSSDQVDKMIWYPTSSGEFSIASAYQVVRKGDNSSRLFSFL